MTAKIGYQNVKKARKEKKKDYNGISQSNMIETNVNNQNKFLKNLAK